MNSNIIDNGKKKKISQMISLVFIIFSSSLILISIHLVKKIIHKHYKY